MIGRHGGTLRAQGVRISDAFFDPGKLRAGPERGDLGWD